VQVGGPISVTFTLKTKDGDPISIEDLDRFSIYVSGPTNNYQRVIVPEGDVANNVTSQGSGAYTYTFAQPFPSTHVAQANDSSVFGPADNELTGTSVAAGAYTVGIEARRTFTVEGQSLRDSGDAAFDFSVGEAPLQARQVVLQTNCNQCHTQLTVHGDNRFSVTNCVLCHTNGAEDLISTDPTKQTPGTSIQFANMIHRIHRGAELPTVEATQNSSDPYRYEVIGFGESVNDFSDVEFPRMPGGTGFNGQTRNCGACHAGAAQEERAYKNPNRLACTGCHNDIDFQAGTMLDSANPAVAAGTLTRDQISDPSFRTLFLGVIQHTFRNGECIQCHNATNPALDPAVVHVPPLLRPENIVGLQATVLSVSGSTGAGFFRPGDTPIVRFDLHDGTGNQVDIGDVAGVSLVISGPVENYQHLIPATGSAASLKGVGGVPTSGKGPFTYTGVEPIPASYPPPLNDSPAFGFDDGWGELSGRPLHDGSYTVMVYAFRQFDFDDATYREASPPGLMAIRVGTSGPATGYAGIVIDAKCNSCHGDLRFHGNSRKGIAECVLCHVAGAEDRPNTPPEQTQDPTPDSIDWKVMIHKIHNAEELDVVKNGGRYDIVGFAAGQPPDTGNVNDFSTGVFPSMPGGAKNCAACHATDAWKAPIERDDVNIWKVACTSCHDSSAVSTHVELNTLAVGREACATCHGDGAFFSVEEVHKIRRTY
jgi:mono/diheme cytochrome c family protein